ncbi:CLUMA_CG012941, isoform B [Clunio marinus]|uniref:CLUMA_CG012941, isoform B n=1 Tax=Clunio marinus TaxID=568069 RepID=A0A1J1IKM1_9DIPT|nr:CLUMA_CG012941, isoform B [Clunio marinus]
MKLLILLAILVTSHASPQFYQNPLDPMIVGGEPANIADFPHSLALLDRGRYICGASNIGRLWAMSAAHCLDANTAPALINLYGGSTSRLTGGRLFFVDQYILHPSYSRITLDNDIALIQVGSGTPLEGFPNVSPIPLPSLCNSACCGVCPPGNDVYVAGWGRIDDGSLPENLMQVSKAILGNTECNAEWRLIPITSRMFCTIIEDGRDSCNGDSGSAVVRDGIQVGVVSFGSSVCGDGSRPAVYVRVEEPGILTIQVSHAYSVSSVSEVFTGVYADQFIVGGTPANIADFPHSLALLNRGSYTCGASIIGRLWAMSAAHCLHNNPAASLINLYGGSTSRLSGGHLFFVDRYLLHPDYRRTTLDFDVAVIQVAAGTPMEGFPNVRPISLPANCNSACCGVCVAGPNVFLAGWGRVDDGSLPVNLMQVDKAIMSNADCTRFWNNITTRMFCTIVENGRDSCNGDSGSAVIRSGVQVGVVSFGSAVCGDGSRPAVYVRVEEPAFRNWKMKIVCSFLLFVAVFHLSQGEDVKYRERVLVRTPFFKRQRVDFSDRIVGGVPAFIEDFPHHLGVLDLSFGGYICGASNIAPRFALSAAHCLEFNTPPTSINLWGGSTSRLTGGRIFFVEQYVLHPQYNTFSLDNDVAIVIVETNSLLQGVPNVSPIGLPANCNTACCGTCVQGPDVTVIGWGIYNAANQLPEMLQQIQKPIFNQAECDRIWGGITSNMFCTTVEDGIDSCNGDSGGGIIRNGLCVGVVSFGSAVCGDGSAPAVYARVESPVIRNWIRVVTGI